MTQEPQQYPQPQQPQAAYYQQPHAGGYAAAPQVARQGGGLSLAGGVWTIATGAAGGLLFLISFILLLASEYGKPRAFGEALLMPSLLMIAIVAGAEIIAGAIKSKK